MVKFSILMIKGRKIIYSLLQASSIFIVLFEEQSRYVGPLDGRELADDVGSHFNLQ